MRFLYEHFTKFALRSLESPPFENSTLIAGTLWVPSTMELVSPSCNGQRPRSAVFTSQLVILSRKSALTAAGERTRRLP